MAYSPVPRTAAKARMIESKIALEIYRQSRWCVGYLADMVHDG
jgi:hypothetical protein